MRFLLYLENCFNKCHAEARAKGKVFPSQYDKEVAEARFRAIDYILAFMGSAIDHTYPFLQGGFKNNLPPTMKKCFEVFSQEYHERGYLSGLRSAARHLNMPTNQLQMVLYRIDGVMRSLAHKAVKEIMKAKTDREIKFAREMFEQKVASNKELILNLR
ncbi:MULTISPECIES: hypothetical protein [Paenibacillaceae]|uniref:Uncharacterized protein n=1 Tax=Paenibacillus thailandensis TaxID=393250 RepID=A0ABW5QR89_9BACL|nr:hypothetical protein [Cohnella massiliensis]